MEARRGQIAAKIEVFRLQVNQESLDFIHSYFMDEEIRKNMADHQLKFSFLYGFVEQFINGQHICYVPTMNGEPVGMGHFTYITSTILQGHQGIFKEYHRHCVKIFNAGISKVFEDTEAQAIVGFTPMFNTAAVKLAQHCGFNISGTIKKAYPHKGTLQDVNVMICERSG